MKILIVGAGGIGGYFGGRLAEAGCDVTFLVRASRQISLQAQGLRVVSPLGNIERPVEASLIGELEDEFDVVLIACKAYHLEQVVGDLRSAGLKRARYLPLLNGLRHLRVLDDAFGAERVLGGLCRIVATLTPDGVVHHLGRHADIRIGSRSEAGSDIVECLAAALRSAQVDVMAVQDITFELWSKFVDLSTLAAATCTMRAPIGIINRTSGGGAFIGALINEAASVAAACGYPIHLDKLAGTRRLLSDPGSTMSASMLRDLEGGGPTEAEHIIGDLCDRGHGFGIAMPFFDVARAHLQAHELRFPV